MAQFKIHPKFKLADPSLLIQKGWINDEQVTAKSGAKPFEVVDPSAGTAWTQNESMDDTDTDAAIAAAAAAFPSWSQVSARQRARIILKVGGVIKLLTAV